MPDIVVKTKQISEEVHTEHCALSILGRLGNANQRYWDVKEADFHTFNWILQDDDEKRLASYETNRESDPKDESVKSAWEKGKRLDYEATQIDFNSRLRNWLLGGNGLFHISGKPGTGKSTLMKYLVKHPKVTCSLEEWAYPKRLVQGKFFFWKPDHGQNSLEALIRGLLYSIIHYDATLVHSAFPRYSGDSIERLFLQSRLDMRNEEVFEALDNLISNSTVSKQFKFCFFIDGLDEVDEEQDTTYSEMVTILQKWADGAIGSIKMCVSSRHFPVFENMPVDHRIRLQDLTQNDIISFVRNSLWSHHVFREEINVNGDDCRDLIHAIISRADGVFLWVNLVVRSVERGLSNADSISLLRERVKCTPQRLEELFKSLLDSIEDCHAQMAVLLLALAKKWLASDGRLSSTLSLSACRHFFHAEETSKTDHIDAVFHPDNIPKALELTPEIVATTRSKVFFRCKGLLETIPVKRFGSFTTKYTGGSVSFLHRSIPEFLGRWISKHMNLLGLRVSHVHNAMCWIIWAEIRFLNSSINAPLLSAWDQLELQSYIKSIACAILANLKAETTVASDQSTAFQLLDLAEDALLPAMPLSAQHRGENGGNGGGCTWNTIQFEESVKYPRDIPCPFSPSPLLAAAEVGFHTYVCPKLAQVTPSTAHGNYFQHCLERVLKPLDLSSPYIKGLIGDYSEIAEALIGTTDADINSTALSCRTKCYGKFLHSFNKTSSLPSLFDTLWIMFLFHPEFRNIDFQKDVFQMIESLLALGALPRAVLCIGRARDWFKIPSTPLKRPNYIQSDDNNNFPGVFSLVSIGEDTKTRFSMICGQKDGFITLGILVAHARPPNMTAILSLIERAHAEEAKSTGGKQLTTTERLHAAVLERHGVRGNSKLVCLEQNSFLAWENARM